MWGSKTNASGTVGGYRHAARTNSFRGAVPLMKQGNLLILVSCVQVIKSPRPPLRRKETGLRHHPEDQIGITGREQRLEWGLNFLFPHSSAGRLPESQQWSPDGAAKAGLIHVLPVQAGGWRNEEVEGHSHQDNHHNSGVWCADKWLTAAINPTREKRGDYICCGGEWCFALYKLEVRGDNAPHFLMEKPYHHSTQLLLHSSASSAQMNGRCCVAEDGWSVTAATCQMENVCQDSNSSFSNVTKVLLFAEAFEIKPRTVNEIER